MLIISKNKDYYDGVAGSLGIDTSIKYIRDEKLIYKDNDKFPKLFYHKQKWNSENIFYDLTHSFVRDLEEYSMIIPFIVGFCGKLFVGWKCHKNRNDITPNFIYDSNYIIGVIENEKSKKYYFKSENNLLDLINKIHNFDPVEIHRSFNSPVFLLDYSLHSKYYNNRVLIINPSLKNYEFYKKIDTFTAYQEISMYISGVLGLNNKKIVEMDDKYKIQKHGFDLKWSFRKKPEKK